MKRILFVLLMVMIATTQSFANKKDNDIVVGMFRLTPCSDNPLEFCISMNKGWTVNDEYEVLHIPSKLHDHDRTYNIVKIEDNGFINCCFLRSVVIDEGIRSIGRHAFDGCSDLRSVSIPSTLSSFGDYVFYNCPELQHIDVDKANPDFDSREQCNAVIRTADDAIKIGCAGTRFPQSVSTIGKYAFCGMNTPATLRIPDHILKVEGYAFMSCRDLYQLIIPASTELERCSFWGCIHLTHVTYEPGSENLKTKHHLTFDNSPYLSCPNLSSISIAGENVPSIENGLFVHSDNQTKSSN